MSETQWACTIAEKFTSRLGAHHQTLEQILLDLQKLGWNPEDVFGVQMALEETLTNAVRHGNCLDESKSVDFQCKWNANELWAQIRDEGCGFDPNAVPDPTDDDHLEIPSGRGMMLIRAYMTEVRFNESGNCVTLIKNAES